MFNLFKRKFCKNCQYFKRTEPLNTMGCGYTEPRVFTDSVTGVTRTIIADADHIVHLDRHRYPQWEWDAHRALNRHNNCRYYKEVGE